MTLILPYSAAAVLQRIFTSVREIKVYMESVEHTSSLWAHNVNQTHKLVCMHTIFFCAQTQIWAKFCHFSKIKLSMESQDYYHISGHIPGPVKRPKAPKQLFTGARLWRHLDASIFQYTTLYSQVIISYLQFHFNNPCNLAQIRKI